LAEARGFAAKAVEFLAVAEDALERGQFTAAAGNAVHAGIMGADAITGVRSASRWSGEHAQAATHLAKAGPEGDRAAPHYRRLLELKPRAEYDPAPIRRTDAEGAVRAAKRLVDIARHVLEAL
jgi:hypothetical protein